MRELPGEAGLAWGRGAGVRLLVIAAHVDDEALLCGGTLHKAAQRGHQATVVFCTRNEQGRWGEESLDARCLRAEAEAEASSARLGFGYCFLGFEDMCLAD
jgi:LmbE family N-acetylglucosaminyl deacetylase